MLVVHSLDGLNDVLYGDVNIQNNLHVSDDILFLLKNLHYSIIKYINNNKNNDKNDPNRNSGTDRSQTRREMSRLEYEVDLIRAENERLRMQNTNLLEQNVKLRSEKHVHPQLKNNTGPLRNHHQNNATKMTAPL